MFILTTNADGDIVATNYETEAEAYASLRENFDGLGEYDNLPDSQLIEELRDGQGVIVTLTATKTERMHPALAEATNFWDGFNIGIEWFVALDGRGALGVAGTGESMQIMSLSLDDDDTTVHSSATEPGTAQFDTGGFEV